jgi:STE24 endopeptidase
MKNDRTDRQGKGVCALYRKALRNTAYLLLAYALYAALCALFFYRYTMDVPELMQGTAADPRTFMDGQLWSQSVEYSRIRNWLYFLLLPLDWIIFMLVLIWGNFAKWGDRIAKKFPFQPLAISIYVALLLAVVFLVKLPLSFYAYRLAVHYDISVQQPLAWLKDRLISFSLEWLLYTLALVLIVVVVQRTRHWWFWSWLFFAPAILFYTFIQPVWIDPLYHKFSHLQDSELETKILNLAEEAGIHTDRVYTVNMSEKSNAFNAYVNGIGPSLRIVLWDTLLERMDDDEILFIMAHEIGHYQMKHLYWSTLGFVLGALLLLFLGSRLFPYLLQRKGKEWGIKTLGHVSCVPLILLVFSLFMFLVQPFANAISRQAEHRADHYALQLTQNPEAAVSAFQNMARASKSDVHPPALVKWIRYGHPTLAERIFFAIHYDSHSDVEP